MATEHGEATVVKFNSVTIPQVTSISGPSLSVSGIETNYMGATVVAQRCSKKSELGTVSVDFVYSSAEAGQTALPTALTAGTEADLVVEYWEADGTAANETWTANSFVSNFELSADDDADVTGSVEFQLCAVPVIANP